MVHICCLSGETLCDLCVVSLVVPRLRQDNTTQYTDCCNRAYYGSFMVSACFVCFRVLAVVVYTEKVCKLCCNQQHICVSSDVRVIIHANKCIEEIDDPNTIYFKLYAYYF